MLISTKHGSLLKVYIVESYQILSRKKFKSGVHFHKNILTLWVNLGKWLSGITFINDNNQNTPNNFWTNRVNYTITCSYNRGCFVVYILVLHLYRFLSHTRNIPKVYYPQYKRWSCDRRMFCKCRKLDNVSKQLANTCISTYDIYSLYISCLYTILYIS